MPFDSLEFPAHIRVLDKMNKMVDLLSDERRWCTKHLRTRDGRFCIRGGMEAVQGDELKKPIALAIRQVTGRSFLHIEHFNDHALTTHALVIKVLHQARENIATGAQPKIERLGAWARLSQVFL